MQFWYENILGSFINASRSVDCTRGMTNLFNDAEVYLETTGVLLLVA